jgi:ribosomal RNA-processing protein 8
MFAVPGWSVPAEALKTQGDPSARSVANLSKSAKPSEKRKRGHSQPIGIEVTSENLAELWEKHVEGKRKDNSHGKIEGNEEQKRKKRRKNKGPDSADAPKANGDDIDGIVEAEEGTAKEARPVEDAGRSEQQSSAPDNSYNDTTIDTPNATEQPRKPELSGKAKYEERIRKKQEKATSKAFGAPPPSPPSPADTGDTALEATTAESSAQADDYQAPRAQQSATKKPNPSPQPPSQKPSPPNLPTTHSTSKPPAKTHPTAPSSSTSETKPSPTEAPRTTTPTSKNGSTTLPPPPPPPHLTPLQKSMAAKLLSSRFRHLNQTLYTTPSTHASHLFTTTPSAYTAYHAGFRSQVAIWPQNPVEGFIADLQARGKIRLGAQKAAFRAEKRGTKKKNKKGAEEPGEALPRTSGTCHIADLGCGDAQLVAALQPSSSPKHLNLRIRSFDLAKGDGPHRELVTVADSCKLPLRDGDVDVAICCLSLMGTNWVDVVDEVGRVVRGGGEVWVAEIRSRFVRVDRAGRKGVEEEKKKKRRKGDEDEEEEDVGTVVEVDSDPDMLAPGGKKKGGEGTDVGAFVEVWRRRGFELKGEVDLTNKMFVKLVFGKMRVGRGREAVGGGTGKIKFIDGAEGEVSREEETKVLKPCVYKLR